jgi:hypothetical protein
MIDQTFRAVLSRGLRAAMYSMLIALVIGSAGCADEAATETDEVRVEDDSKAAASAPADESARIDKSIDGTCLGLSATGTGPLGGANSVAGRCFNANHQLVDSVVWLPGCIGNNDGQLVWGGLYFDRSCRNCVLEFALPHEYRLSCTCRRANGAWVNDTIQVSEYLWNRNGQLSCY